MIQKRWTAALLAAVMLTCASAATAQTGQTQQLIIGDRIVRGNKGTVTIITAFSCPFCQALDARIDPYLNRLARRGYTIEYLPVSLRPIDDLANAAASCRDGAPYMPRIHRLNGMTSIMAGQTPAQQRAYLVALASELGSNAATMTNCTSPQRVAAIQRRNEQARQAFAYEGTPSVYLNRRFIGNGVDALERLLR